MTHEITVKGNSCVNTAAYEVAAVGPRGIKV